MILTDHMMMHFIDLTRFREKRYNVHTKLADWLSWFCIDEDTMKGLDTILERNPAVRRANELYEEFTADKEMMERYEARQSGDRR